MMSSVAPKPSPSAEDLLEQALRLPKDERLKLAEQLCESVEGDASNADVHSAWRSEIVRRARSLMDGSATLIDGEDHVRRLRQKYGA